MTLLFKSKSCKLTNHDIDYGYEYEYEYEEEDEEEEEEEDDEEEEEYEDEEDEDENVGRGIKNPITTPFISPMFNKRSSSTREGNNGGVLDFVVTTLRKSLLVTCSVERGEELSSLDISCPTNVRHVSHVTFDPFNGFLGLPRELQSHVPLRVPSASASVFGVSPESMQCSIDERGNSVPTLLVMMQKRLYAQGGLQAEGIFRINAENSQEECVRSQLNKGVVPRDIDVHCLAGLIKAWFRELPKGVLDSLSPEEVMHCNTEDHCTRLVATLPPMEAGLLNWAINLMADVVTHQHCNKMNARNIAMVFAPNMTQMADPLTALIHAVQVMNLLKTLIEIILRLRQESSESQKTDTHSSTSFGELIFTKLKDVSPMEKPPQSNKHVRSVTLDQLEFSPEHKHQKSRENYTEDGNTYPSVTSRSSPVTSSASVSVYEGGDAEGIFDRLNFRKGVKKLCRHAVFQLSK